MSGVAACLDLAMHTSLDGAVWRGLLMLDYPITLQDDNAGYQSC
jgi:hypothetical protein